MLLPTKSRLLTSEMDAYTSPREIAADCGASLLTLVSLSQALPTAGMSSQLHAAWSGVCNRSALRAVCSDHLVHYGPGKPTLH